MQHCVWNTLNLHISLQSCKLSPISTIHQPSVPISHSLRGLHAGHILKALFTRQWSGEVCVSRCLCAFAFVRVWDGAHQRHPVSVLLFILMCGSSFSSHTPSRDTQWAWWRSHCISSPTYNLHMMSMQSSTILYLKHLPLKTNTSRQKHTILHCRHFYYPAALFNGPLLLPVSIDVTSIRPCLWVFLVEAEAQDSSVGDLCQRPMSAW